MVNNGTRGSKNLIWGYYSNVPTMKKRTKGVVKNDRNKLQIKYLTSYCCLISFLNGIN
jgi:hypothetical protein